MEIFAHHQKAFSLVLESIVSVVLKTRLGVVMVGVTVSILSLRGQWFKSQLRTIDWHLAIPAHALMGLMASSWIEVPCDRTCTVLPRQHKKHVVAPWVFGSITRILCSQVGALFVVSVWAPSVMWQYGLLKMTYSRGQKYLHRCTFFQITHNFLSK